TKRSEYSVYNRANGQRVMVSDTTFATNFIHITHSGEMILAGSTEKPFYQSNKMVQGTIIKKNIRGEVIKTIYLPSFVTAFNISEDEKYVAVGYSYAGVDVYNLETFEKVLSSKPTELVDQVTTISFIENNSTIVYTYKLTGSEKIYFHKIGETSFKTEMLNKDEKQLRVKLSASGKYLAVYNPFKFDLYDLEKRQFLKRPIPESLFMKLNALTFLTDDILIAAGGGMANSVNENYIVGGFSKACLFKVNINTQKHSPNFSFDDLNRSFLNQNFELVNDSTFKIEQHIIGANRLTNDFITNLGMKNLPNDANSNVIWYAEKNLTDKYFKLYRSLENAPTDTILVSKFKALDKYIPFKIHSDAQLIVWASEAHGANKNAKVTNYDGKIIHEYNYLSLYENAAKFSKDGKWFSYVTDASEIKTLNINSPQNSKTYKSGLTDKGYTQDRALFDDQSKKIAYRFFNPYNQNQFTLLSVELNSGKTDTIVNVGLIPYGYGLSTDFNKLALSLPVNFLDTTIFKNQDKLKEAAKFGFKNIYNPIVWLLDTKADSTIAIFQAKNKLRAKKMLVTSKSVIALQDDGLFYHYNLKDTNNVITQWLVGKEQVLLAKDYYYATPGIANRVLINQNTTAYPIGEQDRFYNKPQNIMQDLASNNNDLIKLYNEAYNKRIKQYDSQTPITSFNNLASLNIKQQIHQEFFTKDSLLTIDVNMSKGIPLKRLHVKVNNYAIYGKKGLEVKSNQAKVQLQIPLEEENNDITIQGIDEMGRYLKPLQLNYYSSYKPAKQDRKLYLIAAGVSNYTDQTYNLKYAAKDATDFTKAFKYKQNFDTIIVKTITNDKATAQGIINQIKSLKDVKRDDVIMVFMAGHGVLDDKANFYFATHDMDFNQPTKNGLSYDQIINTLEEVPSKYKVLLLDACHSGLLDRSTVSTIPAPIHKTNDKVTLQDQRGTVVTNKSTTSHKETDVFFFMQKIFNNFSYDNNINILSASLGNSYALENDSLKNGLFTYGLIRGIGLLMAQKKSDNYSLDTFITLQDLTNFLSLDVKKLSNGRQTPTFSMSKSAERVLFIERSPNFTLNVDYKPLDPKDYKPSEQTLHKLFLDRYKNN
ncbi:MAG: hypothetical protein EOO93_04965, partial [Pedobacter sp.]